MSPQTLSLPSSVWNGAVLLERAADVPPTEPPPSRSSAEPEPEPDIEQEPVTAGVHDDDAKLRVHGAWLVSIYQQVCEIFDRSRQRKSARLQERAKGPAPISGEASAAPRGRVKASGYRAKRLGIHVAYVISLGMSGYGQARFFATWLGLGLGLEDIWKAAVGAVFLELSMVGADGYSMYHRQHHPDGGWMPLRCFAYLVMTCGAGLNYAHFSAENAGVGAMFAAATVIGFVLQDITGHLKVRVVLVEEARVPERQKIGFARWAVYRWSAWRVWTRLVADPSLEVDGEFRRELAAKAERKAVREAKKAERKAVREAKKAERKAMRRAEKAPRNDAASTDLASSEKAKPRPKTAAAASNGSTTLRAVGSPSSGRKPRKKRKDAFNQALDHFRANPNKKISARSVASAGGCGNALGNELVPEIKKALQRTSA